MRSLGVICARAGSKSFPGKNFIPFNGEPLCLRSVMSALKSICLTDVVVSTDCEYVKRLVEGYVKIIHRPPRLALDNSPIHEAVLHALMEQEDAGKGKEIEPYDAVVCLQNSQPFRTAEDIDQALRMLGQRPEVDTVMSVSQHESCHPDLAYVMADPYRMASFNDNQEIGFLRQERTPVYFMNGIVFAMRRNSFVANPYVPCGNIAPLEIPAHRAMDIHDWRDWQIAEAMEKISHG